MATTSAQPLVLCVDDEPGILRLVELELQSQGFDVMAASNGPDAIKLFEERQPDIAVLDIVMPDMNGLEVMKQLRQHASTPVILLTARDSEVDKVRGLEL